ncbi:MAG TPA: type II secretion system F family protein [Herpetosiphonaceae bacterium]|nr:type II secretion system F family protein [Herpetosiphonaceae bacterium]
MDQATSIALIAANAILLIAIGAWIQVTQRAREERLAHFIGHFREGASPMGAEKGDTGDRESAIAQRLNRLLSHQVFVQRMRLDLLQAGITVRPTQFFLLRVVLALTGFLAASVLSLSLPPLFRLVLVAAMTVGGYFLVKPYVAFKQRQRINEFEKHFPDALDVMVGALEAGASFTAAVELVSREMPPPLSTEFGRMLRDASVGLSFEEACNGMYERLPSDDLSMMVSAVSIQVRVGGNLAVVLKTLSHTVRERVRVRGDIKTLTAQQSISAKVITALPFLLGGALFALNPDYMVHLFDPGLPRMMAMAGLVMVAIGNWVIRKIVAIEV